MHNLYAEKANIPKNISYFLNFDQRDAAVNASEITLTFIKTLILPKLKR